MTGNFNRITDFKWLIHDFDNRDRYFVIIMRHLPNLNIHSSFTSLARRSPNAGGLPSVHSKFQILNLKQYQTKISNSKRFEFGTLIIWFVDLDIGFRIWTIILLPFIFSGNKLSVVYFW